MHITGKPAICRKMLRTTVRCGIAEFRICRDSDTWISTKHPMSSEKKLRKQMDAHKTPSENIFGKKREQKEIFHIIL